MINLLQTSFKFTERGHLKIAIEDKTKQKFNSSMKTVRFRIEDTGKGMTPETKKRLKQIFQNVNSQSFKEIDLGGVGIGLTISARVVKLMGG